MSATVCATCRRVLGNEDAFRSVCEKCFPREAEDSLGSVGWWMRVAEVKQEERDNLRDLLIGIMRYAATVENENTEEWMKEFAERLNQVARALNIPSVFVWRRQQSDGRMWITCEDIP